MITSNHHPATSTLILKVEKDLLSSSADEAARLFEQALNFQPPVPKSLSIDLTACRMIDSVGLNLLFGVLHRSQELGAVPHLIIAKGPLERIFQVTQISKIFQVQVK